MKLIIGLEKNVHWGEPEGAGVLYPGEKEAGGVLEGGNRP